MGFNFRDVGAMAGRKSFRFPVGRLFRSGSPGRTTADEFGATVRSSGIRSLVDLRCPEERNEPAEYDRILGSCAVVPLPLLSIIESRWVRPSASDPASTAERYLDMLESNGPNLRALWEGLAGLAGAPLLIHCAAGRDRTGIVCALILDAWGADRSAIAQDYALSQGEVGDGYGASPENILAFLALIETRYGNVGNLLGRLGVSQGLIAQLSACFR